MKASFPPFVSCFPPWPYFARPRRLHRRATGAVVGCGNQTWRLAAVRKSNLPKPSPWRGRWAALAARMRCSRRRGVTLRYLIYSNDNGYFVAYTSPPPTAEPLLKEKPWGSYTFRHMQTDGYAFLQAKSFGPLYPALNQNRSLLSMKAFRSSTFTRSCCMVSRSRTVTEPSVSVSKSTVMQYGVPISSWRR